MITIRQLEERGYRRNDIVSKWPFPFADFFMQRKVSDPDGVRYFIEFVHYPEAPEAAEAWMCVMGINEPHCTFEQHRPTDLDTTEQRCNDVWDLLGRRYYERYARHGHCVYRRNAC